MKRTNKVLIVLLVTALSYLFYTHTKKVGEQISSAFDVPDKYTQTAMAADIVVLDFNNYSCNHCQKMHPVLKEAIERDNRVRYIPRTVSWGEGNEWGKTLVAAPYAAGEQGKFIEMHNAIYENLPIGDLTKLISVAKKIGLDTKEFSRDISRSEIKSWSDKNFQLFKDWGINRTPTLMIGPANNAGRAKIYRSKDGTPTVDDLLEQFEKARNR